MSTSWKPAIGDLVISAGMALLFPMLAGLLFTHTGALLPMLLYYGSAWGLAIWRRGGSGYSTKKLTPPPVWFYVHLVVIAAVVTLSYFARNQVLEVHLAGVILTGLVWAVVNASSEQILWLYIFDSWELFGRARVGRWGKILMGAAGFILFTVFVGTIHTLFWARFLHTVDQASALVVFFIIGTSVSGYLHIIVWRQSGRMIYTFIPHFLLNLLPLVWTGYSILPYLIRGA